MALKMKRVTPEYAAFHRTSKVKPGDTVGRHFYDESCRRWDAIFDAISSSVALISLDGTILQYNKATIDFVGKSARKILGQKCWKVFHGTSKQIAGCPVARMLKTRKRESLIIQKGGRWLSVTVDPVFDDDGRLNGGVHIVEDVTEKKTAENRLREFERRHRTLLLNLPGMVYTCCQGGGNWTMEFVSGGSEDLTGYRPNELVKDAKTAYSDLIHPDDRDYVWASVQKSIDRKLPYQIVYRIIPKDKSIKTVWEQGRGVFDADGKLLWLEGYISDITAWQDAENKLKASEKKYRALAEAAQDYIFMIDSRLRIVYMNSYSEKFIGVSAAHAAGKPLKGLVPAKAYRKWSRYLRQVLKSKKSMYVEAESLHGLNTGVTWLGTRLTPVMDSDGRVSAILGISRDISARVEAVRASRENEEFLDNIFTSIRDGISILDKNMNIVRVNPILEKLYEHAMPLVGKKCYDAYHGRDKRCEKCPSCRTLVSGKPAYEIVPYTGPDGKTIGWMDLRTFPLKSSSTGRTEGVIEYVRDITAHVKAAAAIKKSEQKYRGIIDTAGDGFWYADEKGRFLDVNPAACGMLGYRKDEMLRMRISDVEMAEKQSGIERHIRYMNKSGGHFETRHRKKGGEAIDVEVSTTYFVDPEGKDRIIAFIRDISEKKEAEAERIALIRNLSHELKTPIAISEMAYGLMKTAVESGDMEKVKNTHRIFISNLSRLKKDMNNIIDLFSLKTGFRPRERTLCDIRGVLGNVLQNLDFGIKQKGLAVNVDIRKGAGHIYMNKNALRTVLFNVLDNAVKFTERGDIAVASRRKDGYVEIRVKDTGIGIGPGYLDKVFEPFFKGHPSLVGAGVGLVICRNIVRMYGGDIAVASAGPGRGTSVVLKLPLKSASKGGG